MARFIPLKFATQPAQVLELLALTPDRLAGLRVGTAKVAKGERVPPQGYSTHAQDEISLLLAGSVTLEAGGGSREVGAGELVWIPAGEAHRSLAHEESEIVWMLYGGSDAKQ